MNNNERISALEAKVEELKKTVEALQQKCDQLERDMPASLSPIEQRAIDENIRY